MSSRTGRDIRVVLVEPSHPGNIGGAARAMKTMGLDQLALVNPLRYPDPQAQWRAAGAQDVLEEARVFASVTEAIADRQFVVGTSTRARRIPWPLASAAEVAGMILDRPADTGVAILFGRETNGLTNDELQQCHCHLQIPANPDYPSLNLAMAVQVVCYELYRQSDSARAEAPAVPDAQWDRPPASAEQVQGLFDHLERVLVASDFVDPDNPGQTMTRLRRMFLRTSLDDTEVQILRGILKQLRPDVSGS
ncbi:MAG: RNA methyltransferase [Pseudomonadales bacterium]